MSVTSVLGCGATGVAARLDIRVQEIIHVMHLSARCASKIASRTARTGVVGLGYVGLPLAVEFAKSGFHTTGIDLDDRKIAGHQRRRLLHPGCPVG